MPKTLTEEQLNQVKYVSIYDYMNRVDALGSLEDKMAFTTRYLISHGAKEGRDVNFYEAVHLAKMKIADASLKYRKQKLIIMADEAIDPNLPNEEDEPHRLFMVEPAEYLKNETAKLIRKESSVQNPSPEVTLKLQGYQRLFTGLAADETNHVVSNSVSELEIEPTARDFKRRLEAKFKGKLDEAYQATKPGAVAKFFGKYSTAYHNLDEAYKAFNNPKHALHNNVGALDKAAKEYLEHCFPSWDGKRPITQEALNALKGTKKARAELSINILVASAEQKAGEKVFETLVNGINQKRALEAANAPDEVLNDQNQFQNEVNNDIQNEQVANDDQEAAEREYAKVFEDDGLSA